MPIFRHDSPYYTSLSSLVWSIVTGLACFVFSSEWLGEYADYYWVLFSQGMQKTVEESALQSPPEIITRAFLWTFDSLDEDHELERFFAGLPGFRSSKMKLLNAWIGLSDQHVKTRRTAICGRAFDPTDFSVWDAFRRIVSEEGRYGPVAICRNCTFALVFKCCRKGTTICPPKLRHARACGRRPVHSVLYLRRIRSVYVALHQGTSSAPTWFSASTGDDDDVLYEPSSYPLCNIPGYHPDTTPHIHNVSASTSIPRAVLHDDAALVSVSPASTPDAPSASVSALHVDNLGNRIDVSLLNNTIQTPRIPATSSDPATTIDLRSKNIPHHPVTTTSTYSVSSTGAASLQNTKDILVHSDAPAIPPSASTGPGLDDIPGSRCPMSATKSPGTYPQPTSVPKPGQGHSRSPVSEPRDPGKHCGHPGSLLQPPPLPSATDIAIAGRLRRDSDVNKTRDHLPHTSHGQYDIV
ncbi:hypothetical protein EI94DRAFT_1759537 [Lactarius quietus]|nr:hypothetical protein EI94DRAFT_1759537 [Lactarius quietus]